MVNLHLCPSFTAIYWHRIIVESNNGSSQTTLCAASNMFISAEWRSPPGHWAGSPSTALHVMHANINIHFNQALHCADTIDFTIGLDSSSAISQNSPSQYNQPT